VSQTATGGVVGQSALRSSSAHEEPTTAVFRCTAAGGGCLGAPARANGFSPGGLQGSSAGELTAEPRAKNFFPPGAEVSHPGGRPRKYDREALLEAFEAYIAATDIPIVAEFSWRQDVTREVLYQWPEFRHTLAMCLTKKEAQLERKALYNEINVSMAIFSLKQLGWSDRTEQTHRGDAFAPIILSETAARL
jgi:hypothetical protein